eukprot:2251578-Pleurochrysis_carterae.AAC.1
MGRASLRASQKPNDRKASGKSLQKTNMLVKIAVLAYSVRSVICEHDGMSRRTVDGGVSGRCRYLAYDHQERFTS